MAARLFNENGFTMLPDSYDKDFMQIIKAKKEL